MNCFFRHIVTLTLQLGLLLSPALAQAADPVPKPILLGILSTAEPARIHAEWQPFTDYLSKAIGQPVAITVPRGFDKLVEFIDEGKVDIFYVNSYLMYRAKEKGKAAPIAQMMNLNGSVLSRSIVFVRGDSGINNLSQLKGEKVAFVSPSGAGGYLSPRAAFYQAGIKTKEETQEMFTQNLSTSIHKVLLGDAKAATMCGLNFKLMSEKLNTGELKVISTSEDYAEDAIGANPTMNADLRQHITKALTGMHDTEAGRKVLAGMRELKVLKFVPYDANMTETVTRKLIREAKM
ncbi:MAG: phosphate/phosphite/phosphonate ABC transporter substrate-binding protein [Hydrogenophilales bacterium]|nr:phosphate/phosphite/phosphonate ABC transporter substrate-binding protein [Hydrogenophilales bacterium]